MTNSITEEKDTNALIAEIECFFHEAQMSQPELLPYLVSSYTAPAIKFNFTSVLPQLLKLLSPVEGRIQRLFRISDAIVYNRIEFLEGFAQLGWFNNLSAHTEAALRAKVARLGHAEMMRILDAHFCSPPNTVELLAASVEKYCNYYHREMNAHHRSLIEYLCPQAHFIYNDDADGLQKACKVTPLQPQFAVILLPLAIELGNMQMVCTLLAENKAPLSPETVAELLNTALFYDRGELVAHLLQLPGARNLPEETQSMLLQTVIRADNAPLFSVLLSTYGFAPSCTDYMARRIRLGKANATQAVLYSHPAVAVETLAKVEEMELLPQ